MKEPSPATPVRAMSEPDELQNDPAGSGHVARRWRSWLGVALALVVATWGTTYFSHLSGPGGLPENFPGKGRPIDGLTLAPLVGTDSPLSSSDLHGKVVLLNFWGPWCMYCHVEMPHLAEIYETHRSDEGFQFVAVSCGPPGDVEDHTLLQRETAALVQAKAYDFPIHWDPEARTRLALNAAAEEPGEGFGYPTTVILDRRGLIRGLWRGYAKGIEREMAALIEQLLKDKA